ncbi:hypothetical protein [Amycolatopsis pigmentata]|uniref:Serine/threonine protein kinase n=1 Tax=Amycolatopsis pigmentata TaxID=450801 RepID=A0ABW5FLX9_9PSEU
MPTRPGRHRAPKPTRRRTLLGTFVLAVLLAASVGGVKLTAQQGVAENVTTAADTSARHATSRAAAPTSASASATPGTRTQAPETRDGKPRKRERPPAAPDLNTDCTLTVPANPLTAQGLATPYVLSGTKRGSSCHEANDAQSAFVEATIIDPATGKLSVYQPLVIDRGTEPAAPPVMPALPAGAVVGVWFGFNGATLTLSGEGTALNDGACVNGAPGSPFGQFGYCGAPAFFNAANAAIDKGRLTIPPLGVAKDGRTCPTVRDFSVVDQDQSDNVTSTYVATSDGRTAQAGAPGAPKGTKLVNGSDNRLLDAFIDPALGCAPFTAPDLTLGGAPGTSLALDELQAAAHQGAPVALAPISDPMTQVDGKPSVSKTNLYRAGVDQPPVNTVTDTPQAYCTNLNTIATARLAADRHLFTRAASPEEGVTLAEFLTQRLQTSLELLDCPR